MLIAAWRKPAVLHAVYCYSVPLYLFTFHAYRSWNPDHPRGFVQQGKGIQPPNPALARAYDESAKQPPVFFEVQHQRILIWIAFDACTRRDWRLHFVATESTHVHYLVSWSSGEPWNNVFDRLKNLASLMLGRKLYQKQRRWFSKAGSRKRVRDRRHLLYLMNEYLPRHRGLQWSEGDALPQEPIVEQPSAAAEGYRRV